MKMRIIVMGDGKAIPQVKKSIFSKWKCVGIDYTGEVIFPNNFKHVHTKEQEYDFCRTKCVTSAATVLDSYRHIVREERKKNTIVEIVAIGDEI